MLNEITLENVQDDWQACYTGKRLAELFPDPRTPLDVLTMRDGPWAVVPVPDRFWVVLRSEVLPDELMRLFACWCAEQSLPLFEKQYPDDTRPREAIEVSRQYAFGQATAEERDAAKDAAKAAAWAAAKDAARTAAWAAARTAAWDAQLQKLTQMVKVWKEAGDVYGGERSIPEA